MSDSFTVLVKGGTAEVPRHLPPRAAIVLVRLSVDGVETTARLDAQKNMFIDDVPPSWSREDAQEIARALGDVIRGSTK